MDQIFNLMKNRCSCRNFTDDPIPEDMLAKLLDLSVSGPSSGGFQNYSVIKITAPEEKAELSRYCRGQSFIREAAVNLVYCIDLYRERQIAEMLHAVPDTNFDYMKLILLTIDAAIAAQNFCIAAQSKGIGTVYIGNVLNQQKDVAKLLKLPEYVIPVIMVTAGWPKEAGVLSGKFPSSVMIHNGHYEDKESSQLLEAFSEKYAGWNLKPNEKMMTKIGRTATEYRGEDYRQINSDTIWKNNYIDPLSFWYGYYYADVNGSMTQEEHLKFLNQQKMPFFSK